MDIFAKRQDCHVADAHFTVSIEKSLNNLERCLNER